MANSNVSLVLVGNPGAGKTFLVNVLLKARVFDHAFMAGACTTEHDQRSVTVDVNGEMRKLIIHNVPGLIETRPESTERNKAHIEAAFKVPGAHIIMFVFGPGAGGRIQGQDFAAYNALKSAFDLQSTSVVFVFNQLRRNRPLNFDDDVYQIALSALNWKRGTLFNHVFLDEEDNGDNFDFASPAAAAIRGKLLHALRIAVPHRHDQVGPINLAEDKIKEANKLLEDLRQKMSEHEKDTKANLELIQELKSQKDAADKAAKDAHKRIDELEKAQKSKQWWQTALDVVLPIAITAMQASSNPVGGRVYPVGRNSVPIGRNSIPTGTNSIPTGKNPL